MSDHEVIAENYLIRVRVVPDEYPEPPYDEGASPILQVEWRGCPRRVQPANDAAGHNQSIIDACASLLTREADGREKFERYLRIFHGTTSVVWYGLNRATDYLYVTFDTAEWRQAQGLTDEYLMDHADVFAGRELANMDEWIAYVEGDVWMVQVDQKIEKRTETRTKDGHTFHISSWREEWELADLCGGFYGYEYAVESAKEQFEIHAGLDSAASV